jgi:ATP-dependent protease Clp ATPase subunit
MYCEQGVGVSQFAISYLAHQSNYPVQTKDKETKQLSSLKAPKVIKKYVMAQQQAHRLLSIIVWFY